MTATKKTFRINKISICFYAGALILVLLAATMNRPIQQQRKQMLVVMDNDITPRDLELSEMAIDKEQLPASTAMMLAVGGPLRGVMVNLMWYQANQLQQENRHFQAATYAKWLTRLMPRYPEVWDFLSWNMAWNISVKHKYGAERWDWIQKGVNMLQRDAIPLNPDAPLLYKQLAWIYFFKIGGDMDDMHWHYKREFISKWHFLLGPPPEPEFSSRQDEDNLDVRIAAIKRIVDTSPVLSELLIELDESSPDEGERLRRLISFFESQGYELNEDLLVAIQKVRVYADTILDDLMRETGVSEKANIYDQAIREMVTDPRQAKALDTLVSHLQHRALIQNYYMKPPFMLKLMEEHGPFDWRHPMAHGLYWAEMGVAVSERVGRQKGLDLLNTRRSVVQNIQLLAFQGIILFDPIEYAQQSSYIPRFMPYSPMIESFHTRLSKDRALMGQNLQKYKGTGQKSLRRAHQNFLETAVRNLFLSGDIEGARKYQLILRDDFTELAEDVQDRIDYAGPLDVFAWRMVSQELIGFRTISNFIVNIVRRGANEGLALDNHERFKQCLTLARQAHDKHKQDMAKLPQQSARVLAQRTELPPLKKMIEDTLAQMLSQSAESITRRSLIYKNLPEELKTDVYPRIIPRLERELRETVLKVDKLFPVPENYSDEPTAVKPNKTAGETGNQSN